MTGPHHGFWDAYYDAIVESYTINEARSGRVHRPNETKAVATFLITFTGFALGTVFGFVLSALFSALIG